MDILIFEYMTSGGWVGAFPKTILPEGLAIARTLSGDLVRGNVNVFLPLDERLWNYRDLFMHCEVRKVSKTQRGENIYQLLASELKRHDAIFLIAPESDQILFNLTARTENVIPILGASSQAVACTTSKWETQSLAKTIGLSVPKTRMERKRVDQTNWKALETLNFPLIIKPDDSCGADGCTLVHTRNLLNEALDYAFSFSKKVLIQEFITGIPISTAFVTSKDGTLFLTINRQYVSLSEKPGQKSEYLGGLTPFEHSLSKDLRDMTEAMVGKIPGIQGYTGIDFVTRGRQAFLMEINPRLTTSYVGISAIAKKNLGRILVNSGLQGKLPTIFETQGYSFFGKAQVNNTITDDTAILEQPEVVIPPIQLPSGERSSVFVRCVADTPTAAQKKFEEIVQQLKNPSTTTNG